jgi:hypothetical protein
MVAHRVKGIEIGFHLGERFKQRLLLLSALLPITNHTVCQFYTPPPVRLPSAKRLRSGSTCGLL